jgi:hypothetical protein
MKRLALARVLVACSKANNAQPQPKPQAASPQEASMWTVPLKTLQGSRPR